MRYWIISCFVCLAMIMSVSNAKAKSEQPNIIFILTDDQGYGDVSAHGNPYLKTPNMDFLRRNGTRFSNFVVSPSCAPTRCALMTGKHEFRSGVTHTVTGRREVDLRSTTLAQVLKSAGYKTGIFGKWHLGSDGAYRPEKRGFDVSLTTINDTQNSHFDPTLLFNGTKKKVYGFREDILFDEAMMFMEDNKDAPFFCYIPTYSAHAPLKAPQEYIDRNNGNAYYAMISNIDDNIGRVLSKLKELQIDDNTLVIFMNDNGGTWGVDNYNAGMRGCKGTPWIGGTRASSFWYFPHHFKPKTVDVLAGHIDVFPTLAELSGYQLPEGLSSQIDGVSLLPLLTGEETELEDRMIISHVGRWPDGEGQVDAHKYTYCSVHWKNYLLVRSQTCGNKDCVGNCRIFYQVINGRNDVAYSKNAGFHYAALFTDKWTLYDIKNDGENSHDIVSQHPDIVKKMSDEFEQWWNEVYPHIHRKAENPRWSQPP
jgi:arylsulfatase A-like enzyme